MSSTPATHQIIMQDVELGYQRPNAEQMVATAAQEQQNVTEDKQQRTFLGMRGGGLICKLHLRASTSAPASSAANAWRAAAMLSMTVAAVNWTGAMLAVSREHGAGTNARYKGTYGDDRQLKRRLEEDIEFDSFGIPQSSLSEVHNAERPPSISHP
nr:hypothetical protein CFP56_43841 [Quercus suber]